MTSVERAGSDLGRVVELVARADGHEVVTLTENGEPVAVVLSPQEWESITETLDVLSNPGELEDIQASRAEFARGDGVDGFAAIDKYLTRKPGQSGYGRAGHGGGDPNYEPRHARGD